MAEARGKYDTVITMSGKAGMTIINSEETGICGDGPQFVVFPEWKEIISQNTASSKDGEQKTDSHQDRKLIVPHPVFRCKRAYRPRVHSLKGKLGLFEERLCN